MGDYQSLDASASTEDSRLFTRTPHLVLSPIRVSFLGTAPEPIVVSCAVSPPSLLSSSSSSHLHRVALHSQPQWWWSMAVEARHERSSFHFRTSESPDAEWRCSFLVPITDTDASVSLRFSLWRTSVPVSSAAVPGAAPLVRQCLVAQGRANVKPSTLVSAGGVTKTLPVRLLCCGGAIGCGDAVFVVSIEPPDTAEETDFEDDGVELGSGTFSVVRQVRRRSDGAVMALKRMDRHLLEDKGVLGFVENERGALQRLRHPFLVRLYHTLESDTSIGLVLEAARCDLFSLMVRPFSEREARFVIAEVLEVVDFLHGNHLLIRDVKPENILISQSGHVQLCDLGLSEWDRFNGAPHRRAVCGSPEYWSPEILLTGVYGEACDFWAIGVMLYELLFAALPFPGDTAEELSNSILHSELAFPTGVAHADRVGADARSLISGLLQRDPAKRIATAAAVRCHRWFAASVDWRLVPRQALVTPLHIF